MEKLPFVTKEKAEEKLSASAATAQQTVTDAKEKADKMVAEAHTVSYL